MKILYFNVNENWKQDFNCQKKYDTLEIMWHRSNANIK